MTNEAKPYAVVICTYERYNRLPFAVESVLKQDFPPELFEIWVIDNSPPSVSREQSRARYENEKRVRYVEVDTPGLSNARNVAARKTEATWLVFLDDDAVAAPDWLSGYHESLSQLGGQVGAIGGRVSVESDAPKPNWLHVRLLVYLSAFYQGDEIQELPPTLTPAGANMAVRRDLLLESGGFDPRLGRNGPGTKSLLSGEESSLFQFLHSRGEKVFYTPRAQVKHFIAPERLRQAWFRRRVAWQSVTDQAYCDPGPAEVEQMWTQLMDYLSKVPPEHIPYAGLFWNTDDPDLFDRQVRSVQYFTHLLLAEGSLPLS